MDMWMDVHVRLLIVWADGYVDGCACKLRILVVTWTDMWMGARAQGMELAVPGTYIAGEPLVTISAFAPQLQVRSARPPCALYAYVG
eukprot:131593-Chlamydomonas_euryale.AAC.1